MLLSTLLPSFSNQHMYWNVLLFQFHPLHSFIQEQHRLLFNVFSCNQQLIYLLFYLSGFAWPSSKTQRMQVDGFAPSFSVFNGIMSSPFMFQWKLPSQGSLIPRDWIKRNLHSSPLQRIHFCWSLV